MDIQTQISNSHAAYAGMIVEIESLTDAVRDHLETQPAMLKVELDIMIQGLLFRTILADNDPAPNKLQFIRTFTRSGDFLVLLGNEMSFPVTWDNFEYVNGTFDSKHRRQFRELITEVTQRISRDFTHKLCILAQMTGRVDTVYTMFSASLRTIMSTVTALNNDQTRAEIKAAGPIFEELFANVWDENMKELEETLASVRS
uniref:hypothetical protein n=1 Tax=Eubacterium cellulosolvens TaxID=29322 RepID=UPI000482A02C|nr:hypothetical protein [[Eubacterium] cellulosolvens]